MVDNIPDDQTVTAEITPASAPQEQVLYSAPSTTETAAIPEEYLTDEDLYPTQPQGAGGAGTPLATLKKKQPLIITAVISVIFLFVVIFFVARLLSGPKEQKQVKLVYWGLWESESVMADIIKSYTQAHPNIEITYTQMDPKDNYRERLIERTKVGTGPDIFRFHNTWVPQLTEVIQPAPVTVFTPDEFSKLFYPVINKDLVIENNIVGVPLGIDGLMLVYNEKILQAAGVSAPPASWEQLLDIARQVTVKDASGTIVTAGIALGTAENISHFSDILGLMFMQNAVSFGSLAQDANAISVLDTYSNFALSVNYVWSEQMDNSIKTFAAEKVAMIFAPSWEVEVIKQLNPDISLKTVSVPQITGGRKKNIASYWVEGVSKASPNQQAAWEFLKYLTEKETLIKLYEAQVKSGRLFGYPYPRIDMADLLLQDPYISPIIKDALIFDSFPLISFTYDNGLNDNMVRYSKDGINKILQNSSSQDALRTMSQGFDQVYTDYQFTPKLFN